MSHTTRRPLVVLVALVVVLAAMSGCGSEKAGIDKNAPTVPRSTAPLPTLNAAEAAKQIDALKVGKNFCDAVVSLGSVASRVAYDVKDGKADPDRGLVTSAISRYAQRTQPIVPSELTAAWRDFDASGIGDATPEQTAAGEKVKAWLGDHCSQTGK